MASSPPLLLEPGDAALQLGISAASVRKLADAGTLPMAGRTGRGLRLFRPADVTRFRDRLARERAR